MTVTLYDDFENPLGQFTGYDTYDSAQRTQLARQKHVDLRSFEASPITEGYTMYDLDVGLSLTGSTMSALDALSMATLESGVLLVPGESWTAGVVGPQSTRNYFKGITLSCKTGANPTSSVMATGVPTAPVLTIDISSFAATDYISLALPAFPLASVTRASCFLDISSDATGAFAAGHTDSLAFTSSTTTLIAGDSEARFPVSLLVNANKTAIAAIRLRIQATGACTFRCLAIRAIASTWEFAPLDQNTLYGRLGATVPPTGTATPTFAFPTATAPVSPSDWPVLLRSDGTAGPTLVDIEVGAVVQTGSNTADNKLTLYFRELPVILNTVGALSALNMGQLEALGQQPDYSFAHLDDFAHTRYLTVTMEWGTTNALHIKDQAATGYDYTALPFAAQSSYYLVVKLRKNSLRAIVYPISVAGAVDWSTVVADTTAVIDDNFVVRYPGRYGFYAQLNEGDTYVQSIRPRSVVYAEYRSAPLCSDTPVVGARLYASNSPDVELYQGAIAAPGTIITPDNTKSQSGRCIRVNCDGNQPVEGLLTVATRFENFSESVIEFDILAPKSASLFAVLSGENQFAFPYMPAFPTNRWTHITLPLEQVGETALPGSYAFYLLQNDTGQNTWYVDNLSVRARAVNWAGRGQAADPWLMNDPTFIEFGDEINDPVNAAMLGRGNSLQIRGQVLTQGATIDSLKVLPKYAELGNFVWAEQIPTYPAPPVPSFTTSTGPPSSIYDLHVNASASTATAGIAAYYWTFGDGQNGYGQILNHAYKLPGLYTVTLTVIDTLGQKVSTSRTVAVVPAMRATARLPLPAATIS